MVSGEKNDSRVKKKQKMVFAKDRKQAIMAIVVVFIFFANGFRMIIQYVQEQARINSAPVQQVADDMAPGLEGMPPNPNTAGANADVAKDANDIYQQTLDLKKESSDKALLTVDSENRIGGNGKKIDLSKNPNKVTIMVANSGRPDPFLPENEILPASLSYLTPPPETIQTGSQAEAVMSTTISGILYDRYSPSAIINIGGADYLVKKGDVINGYKVLSIEKTQVLVQLGKNTYKAGVGELLSKTDMNFNTIANLNKKFGGNDVAINVRKKGY